ncbi:MAG TPA: phytanoyl-CoA dioxygenase family protein [Bacteroidia bacterium]
MKTFLYRLRQRFRNATKKKVDDLTAFNQGYATFQQTGETPVESYFAFIRLYCKTNGKFNEDKHKEIIANNLPANINTALTGALGTFEPGTFNSMNNQLNQDGYVPLTQKISPETVKKLVDFAYKTETTVAPKYDKKVVYNDQQLISEMYRFDMQDLVNNSDIQQLIMDPVLINIARKYLGCEPIFDFPAMWWSTPFLKEASAEAAQLYHFDLDRIKWLKIFIYLTDVNENNGPHRLIKGSHRVGAKPESLLKRGYARIPDEDLTPHYKKEDFIVVTGDAGAVFLEDTKCWHKGTPLKSGHRLVLEFEYTSSMFGANYPKFQMTNASEEFKTFCKNNPVYAANFRF